MALPPTYVYSYISDTPEDTFEILKKAGFLNKSTIKDKQNFIKKLSGVKKEYESSNSNTTGPNLTDLFADASRKFLNKSGVKLADTEVYSSTFFEKVSVFVLKIVCRVKAFAI